ncbi:cytochrome C biogenesis protein CcdA [Luteimicrobium album]|uniref:Cytochrome C biogenesis protein CcdA n=1 Tax=Luteimicrobium album TaxID=1054550 RepID=A0ABQ6HXZ9_9MICO|nr:cytochrome c biogenesis protein CcdA [Luteimicrobium album]GMA22847.1 cytochrome C biogenesis protein CcdA [Luteimicrobium album]
MMLADGVLQASSGFATTAFSGSMLLAVPVAVVAGFVSFASPCVLPLVPGYVGYVSGWAATNAGVNALPGGTAAGARTEGPASVARGRARVVAGVGLFVAGFTLVFVVLGGFVGALGTQVRQAEDVLIRVLGVVVILMGLAFLGALPFLQRERRIHVTPRAGLWGAPLLGIVFGLGWTPCLGPTLTAVYALALDQATLVRGAALAVAYCVGLGVPFVLVALGLQSSKRMLDFLRRHRLAFLRIGGGMLVLIGLAMVTGVWGTWTAALGGWASRYGVQV